MTKTKLVVWKNGESIENKRIILSLPLVSKIIEYVKNEGKPNAKVVKVNRLATLLGNNGFGSFLLGQDIDGDDITISLKINKVKRGMENMAGNSDFDLLED